jgi:hypothetical protein
MVEVVPDVVRLVERDEDVLAGVGPFFTASTIVSTVPR